MVRWTAHRLRDELTALVPSTPAQVIGGGFVLRATFMKGWRALNTEAQRKEELLASSLRYAGKGIPFEIPATPQSRNERLVCMPGGRI